MKRESYPLQWPEGWKRARVRAAAKFMTRFVIDRDAVIRQLKRRGAGQIVITSNLPTRQDGLPYANGRRGEDPGVAVYWVERGHEHVMACDRWTTIDQNLRAIDMSLVALRGLDRWGAAETVERAFAGFAALPAGAPAKRPWRKVLEMEGLGLPVNLPSDVMLVIAKTNYRKLIQKHHPDAGGDHEIAAELNAAIAEAEQELTSSSQEARA